MGKHSITPGSHLKWSEVRIRSEWIAQRSSTKDRCFWKYEKDWGGQRLQGVACLLRTSSYPGKTSGQHPVWYPNVEGDVIDGLLYSFPSHSLGIYFWLVWVVLQQRLFSLSTAFSTVSQSPFEEEIKNGESNSWEDDWLLNTRIENQLDSRVKLHQSFSFLMNLTHA